MKRYWIDWSDQHYPAIRPEEDADEHEALVTFAEAKREVIDCFRDRADFARLMIKQTRALRATDIKSERGES